LQQFCLSVFAFKFLPAVSLVISFVSDFIPSFLAVNILPFFRPFLPPVSCNVNTQRYVCEPLQHCKWCVPQITLTGFLARVWSSHCASRIMYWHSILNIFHGFKTTRNW
jgi:hypothetical protein